MKKILKYLCLLLVFITYPTFGFVFLLFVWTLIYWRNTIRKLLLSYLVKLSPNLRYENQVQIRTIIELDAKYDSIKKKTNNSQDGLHQSENE